MYELQRHRKISPLDEMLPPFYYAYLLAFPMSDHIKKEIVESILRESLSDLLSEYPYLAANINRQNLGDGHRPGHLSLDIPTTPQDRTLVFKNLTQSMIRHTGA